MYYPCIRGWSAADLAIVLSTVPVAGFSSTGAGTIAADLTIAGTAAAGRRRRFHFTELPPRRLDQIDLMPARASRAREGDEAG